MCQLDAAEVKIVLVPHPGHGNGQAHRCKQFAGVYMRPETKVSTSRESCTDIHIYSTFKGSRMYTGLFKVSIRSRFREIIRGNIIQPREIKFGINANSKEFQETEST